MNKTEPELDSNNNKPITTIIIADDHPLFRESLRNTLEKQTDFKIIGEAGDGEEAVRLAIELKPDVAIMDIGMPLLNGLEATRQIKEQCSNTAVLVLTVHNDSEHILGILEAGAAGYLTKSAFGNEVVNSIRSVITGETVLSTQVFQNLLKYVVRYPTKPLPLDLGEKLSIRELTILRLAAKGLSNKDIAGNLNISPSTVKSYLVDIFSKLGVGSRTEAIFIGLRYGFIQIGDLE